MDVIQAIYGTGAGIFGVCALITGSFFVHFVRKGRCSKNWMIDHVHWLNSIWVYMILCTTFLLLTCLYAANSVGYGFSVKTNLHVIDVARWLVMTVVGTLYQGCLAYILTNDHRTRHTKKKKTSIGAQNFFIIFFYALSQVCILMATITVIYEAHIILMVASLVTFIIAMLLYFFPTNKIRVDATTKQTLTFLESQDRCSGVSIRKTEEEIMNTYRIAFMVFIVISYALNFIIWFLSRSNDISDTISLKGEAIAYLVSDFILVVPFAFIMVYLTVRYRLATLMIKDNETKETSFQQRTGA